MAEIKLLRKLIYAGDAHRAILEADPRLAYCIERIKAVDAVEVVRCKDCYFSERANIGEARICHYWSPFKEALVPNDGFCYRGERKDNG